MHIQVMCTLEMVRVSHVEGNTQVMFTQEMDPQFVLDGRVINIEGKYIKFYRNIHKAFQGKKSNHCFVQVSHDEDVLL